MASILNSKHLVCDNSLLFELQERECVTLPPLFFLFCVDNRCGNFEGGKRNEMRFSLFVLTVAVAACLNALVEVAKH